MFQADIRFLLDNRPSGERVIGPHYPYNAIVETPRVEVKTNFFS
jgi:hypothetical protein